MVLNYVHGSAVGSKPARADAGTSEATLELFLLSSFRVVVNGTSLTGRLGAKGRALLKILAAYHDRVLPRDALMEMLWPDTDPDTGAISLKVAAHNLRTVLEPDKQNGAPGTWIIFRDGTYCLNPEAAVWIDIETMEAHRRNGLERETGGDAARARAEYGKAAALYTGDFLEEDLYEEWTIIRREQLRDTYLETVSRLADLAIAAGDHADAIRHCHKIIGADPCREDAYRTLMQCHGELKQRARAGAWYAVCRTMLRRELGVEPARQTVDTFEALFRDID